MSSLIQGPQQLLLSKKRNIPVNALSAHHVVLLDYNQLPMPVGVKVELSFNRQSMHGCPCVCTKFRECWARSMSANNQHCHSAWNDDTCHRSQPRRRQRATVCKFSQRLLNSDSGENTSEGANWGKCCWVDSNVWAKSWVVSKFKTPLCALNRKDTSSYTS